MKSAIGPFLLAIVLTLAGGKALSFRFSMDTPLIRFFVLLDEAKKKAQQ